VAHDYLVLYPSGARQQLRGVFGLLTHDGAAPLPMIRSGETVTVLDPRAVIARNGLVISEPRGRPVPAWAAAWLVEHPEWPRVATESLG
jgi:hypothetical protein